MKKNFNNDGKCSDQKFQIGHFHCHIWQGHLFGSWWHDSNIVRKQAKLSNSVIVKFLKARWRRVGIGQFRIIPVYFVTGCWLATSHQSSVGYIQCSIIGYIALDQSTNHKQEPKTEDRVRVVSALSQLVHTSSYSFYISIISQFLSWVYAWLTPALLSVLFSSSSIYWIYLNHFFV